jgi:hypothetical protein
LRTRFFLGVLALSAEFSCLYAGNPFVFVKETQVQEPVQAQEHSDVHPNRSSRFRADSTNFTIFADLLVWTAKESGSDNWAEVITTNGLTENCDIRQVHFGWDPGFRVGVGYGMRHDQWDTQFYYTWFHTQGNDRVSSRPGSVFSSYTGNFYVDNPTGIGISGISYQKARVRWMIQFDMLDWELGRSFWISKALSIRPFVGLKGGWIHQSIHTKWQTPSPPPNIVLIDFHTARENLKNHFGGLGPCGGLDTKWDVFVRQNHTLSLFGDISGAIMWGHWTFGDVYKNDIGQEVVIKTSSFNSGASMLRTLMGFEWDAFFNRGRFHFSTKLGYEMQFWLDQLQYYSFDTGRLSNVLTLQGGTLEFRFDF